MIRKYQLYLILFYLLSTFCFADTDPLPSWNNGAVKQNIINFVKDVTDPASVSYVDPKNRIAAFDNDGTMWVEHPVYTEVVFTFDRIRALAKYHPEWKTQAPYNYVLSNDEKELAKLTHEDMNGIYTVTHAGMTIESFSNSVKDWLATAKHPRFHKLYTKLYYQPMLEVMNYLRSKGFMVYIVSGGGQDFIRTFAPNIYHVQPEFVIGTAAKTEYTYISNKPDLVRLSYILFMNNYGGKVESLHLSVGKKPIIAFGNSDGDRQMLEWTQSGPGKRLMVLIHHDDALREYAYGADTKIGAFSNALMSEAKEKHWQIISMKQDWKTIFPS